MPKPSTNSYAPYFQRYIDQVPETDLNAAFQNQAAHPYENKPCAHVATAPVLDVLR